MNLNGGTITGNISTSIGGGIYILSGTLKKNGTTIYTAGSGAPLPPIPSAVSGNTIGDPPITNDIPFPTIRVP
ncbi:MAG: hypothetical protein CMH41_00720 [Micrococcales bacterium]|nr:hypothetical protein [Micrococcales bacterium]